jgi:Acyl-CoA reductase (LuxC)
MSGTRTGGSVSAIALCERLDTASLLRADDDAIRVPVLARGRLVVPEGDAVLEIREATIDRATMRPDGGARRLVLPRVAAADLLYEDPGTVRARLAAVPFAALCDWLDAAAELLEPDGPLGARVRTLVAAASDLADPLLDAGLRLNATMMRAFAVREVVDRELAAGGVPGSRFLDEWVEVDAPVWDGPTGALRAALASAPAPGAATVAAPSPRVRAFPTLQIHVTAGNAPVVAPASALRLLATRSGGVVKLPSASILPGAALAVALHAAAEAHPAARAVLDALSLVYWKGGDAAVEEPLFDPAVFDRVVVWGAPDAVERVSALAAGAIRTLTFNPRYGVSLIGREALADDAALDAAARLAAADVLVWNQRACIASLVHYVEADAGGQNEAAGGDVADRWAAALRVALTAADRLAPSAPSPAALGQIQRMRRGSLVGARWHWVGGPGRDARAAVVVAPGPFDLSSHPLSRVVIVRRVARLDDALALLHRGVSTVGVHPEPRRLALRDPVAARGVSNIVPLGHAERAFAGMPHDGMRVLSGLVEWTTG